MKEEPEENTKKRGNMKMKTELQKQLFALQDPGYREFHAGLIPGIPKEDIIGIRTPVLRKFAGEFARDHSQEAEAFLKELPHRYYEENNLHMLLVTKIKDYPECLRKVKEFLPYINNWATCDLPAPKCFEEYREELLPVIREWLLTKDTYTIRYGIGLLMRLYLDDMYRPEYADLVARVRSETGSLGASEDDSESGGELSNHIGAESIFEEFTLSKEIKTGRISKSIKTHRKLQEQREKYNWKMRKRYIEITVE